MGLNDLYVNKDASDGGGFPPIPRNYYKCMVEEVQDGPTKSGDGRRVMFKLRILDGEFAKRIVFDYAVYEHAKADVAQRGVDKLSLMAMALGHEGALSEQLIMSFADSIVDAKIETTKKNGEDNTNVWSYRKYESSASISGLGAQVEGAQNLYNQPAANRGGFTNDDLNF